MISPELWPINLITLARRSSRSLWPGRRPFQWGHGGLQGRQTSQGDRSTSTSAALVNEDVSRLFAMAHKEEEEQPARSRFVAFQRHANDGWLLLLVVALKQVAADWRAYSIPLVCSWCRRCWARGRSEAQQHYPSCSAGHMTRALWLVIEQPTRLAASCCVIVHIVRAQGASRAARLPLIDEPSGGSSGRFRCGVGRPKRPGAGGGQ